MTGKSARGHWPPEPDKHPASHDHHMEHFDLAMQDALKNWDGGDATGVPVALTADISKNPGGVKEYFVQIGP
jgi:hypothetical protein